MPLYKPERRDLMEEFAEYFQPPPPGFLPDVKSEQIPGYAYTAHQLRRDPSIGRPIANILDLLTLEGNLPTTLAQFIPGPSTVPSVIGKISKAGKPPSVFSRLKPGDKLTLYRGAKQEIYGRGGEVNLRSTRWTPDIDVAKSVGGRHIYKIEVPVEDLVPAQELFDQKVAKPEVLLKWRAKARETYPESSYPEISASLDAPGEPQVLLRSGMHKIEKLPIGRRIVYRAGSETGHPETGTWYWQERPVELGGKARAYEIEIENPLVVPSSEIKGYGTSVPSTALLEKWFPEYTRPVVEGGPPLSHVLTPLEVDKIVAREAVRRGYDAIVYGEGKGSAIQNLKSGQRLLEREVNPVAGVQEGFIPGFPFPKKR